MIFPKSYQSNPTVGYKIVRVDLNNNKVYDFVTGFLQNNADIKGRPVDIVSYKNGFLISDDKEGKIYRLWYDNNDK